MRHGTRLITVFGATGFTGRLVAFELARRRVPFALAGRNAAKLQEVSSQLGGVETLIAEAGHPASLVRLAASSTVIINCAGPFIDLGEPVVEAAIASGTHYLDTTGEQAFVKALRERHHAAAEERGIAVAPAMAFEVAVPDCAATVAAEGFRELHTIRVIYSLNFHPSRGSQRTALRVLESDAYAYEHGRWIEERPGQHRLNVDLAPGDGMVSALSFPSAEIFTIPWHEKVDEVRAYMAVPTATATAVGILGPIIPSLAWVSGGLVRRLLGDTTVGPDAETRKADRFVVAVDALGLRSGRVQRRRVTLMGADTYGLSAVIAAEAALRMVHPSFKAKGVLAPAQIFTPRDFLDDLHSAGLTYTTTAAER